MERSQREHLFVCVRKSTKVQKNGQVFKIYNVPGIINKSSLLELS